MFPLDLVVVFENAVEVAKGRIADLRYAPGPDDCTDIFRHPDAIPGFIAKFFPADGRLN